MIVGFISRASGPGHDAAALVLLAFVVSFLSIRTSTRMIRAEVRWWPGNVETRSGLHLHHMVWGIALMLLGGFAAFAITAPLAPWFQIAAVAFGIGAGLTFDEFALWLHLRDVYWSEQGRDSLDAVVLVVAFMALVVLGFKPFGLNGGESTGIVLIAICQALVLSVLTMLKGRLVIGALALFMPFFGVWGACRLANPRSPWAVRRYSAEKLARAHARYPATSRTNRFRRWFFDAIGGRPDVGDPLAEAAERARDLPAPAPPPN